MCLLLSIFFFITHNLRAYLVLHVELSLFGEFNLNMNIDDFVVNILSFSVALQANLI